MTETIKVFSEYENEVREFQQATDMAVNAPYDVSLLELRQKLINEEASELNVEINTLISELKDGGVCRAETLLRFYKELADLQYVLSGTVVSFGIPMREVFRRVHQSNMSKLVDGKPLKRADGKTLKGPNYKKPDLTDLLDPQSIKKEK
jgi:predicted HAD superfamily Cof-like phosphohydrolase